MYHPKAVFGKYGYIVFSFLVLSGCLSGQRPPVMMAPHLDKRVHQITQLPLNVDLYIEPHLRNYVQDAPIKQYEAGAQLYTFPNFVFPFGEPLSLKIEEMSKVIFKKVTLIDNLQNTAYGTNETLDGILTVGLKSSDIELYIEQSVGRAGRPKSKIAGSGWGALGL